MESVLDVHWYSTAPAGDLVASGPLVTVKYNVRCKPASNLRQDSAQGVFASLKYELTSCRRSYSGSSSFLLEVFGMLACARPSCFGAMGTGSREACGTISFVCPTVKWVPCVWLHSFLGSVETVANVSSIIPGCVQEWGFQ